VPHIKFLLSIIFKREKASVIYPDFEVWDGRVANTLKMFKKLNEILITF